MPPPTALGGISRERFKHLSEDLEIYRLIGDNWLHKAAVNGVTVSIQLPNAIKYCTKVHKMGVAGQ